MAFLWIIFDLLVDLFSGGKKKIMDLNLNIAPPADPISSIVASGLNLAGGVVKLTDDELMIVNSPTAIAARHNCSVQAAQDAIVRANQAAMKSGDGSEVDKQLS